MPHTCHWYRPCCSELMRATSAPSSAEAPDPEDPPGNVVTTYGMTESAGGVVYNGLALNGVGLRSTRRERSGCRGQQWLRCYRDGSDPKDSEGWYRTGDAGSVDPSTGILTVAGRTDDLIITGGENVWPEPVEVALLNHPGVQQVAVVGRPDPNGANTSAQ